MPLPAKGSNASSTTDYEQLGYDAASNVTSRRLRDAQSIALTYDNLDRVTLKNLPGTEPDVSYAYDNLGRLNYAIQPGHVLSFTYDALGRNLQQGGPLGNSYYEYDLAGRRARLTYPGSGLFIDYDYLVTGEVTKLRENGATTGVGVLATLAYDDLGRRTSLTRGNGAVTTYGYDPVSRLASLAENMTGTANDQTSTFSYNPASQIGSVTRTNDNFAWTGHGNGSTASAANGLNQLTCIGGSATAHDARGNVTNDPTSGKTYGYSSENLLTSASGGVALGYDPAMRLYQVSGVATSRLAYDGTALIAEYDGANAITKRYVHGPGVDEPLVEYDGSGTAAKRWLHADERGSVIAQSDASGNVTTINRYDEYGKPQGTNAGRFQYTGQTWLGEVGAYYYKARFYSPGHGGRFLQTDRIGFAGGINLYAYVLNDPVNWVDSLGLKGGCSPLADVCGWRLKADDSQTADANRGGNFGITPPRVRNDAEKGDKKEDQCAAVKAERGTVVAKGGTVTAILGLGLSLTKGTFRNVETGSTGEYTTWGAGIGAIGGISDTESTYRDIQDFIGYNESLVGGISIPGANRIPVIGRAISRYLGVGASLHTNVNNEVVGKTSDEGPGRAGLRLLLATQKLAIAK